MEVTGIALGVLALLKPLVSSATDTIASERNYGSDAEKLRVRCSAQQNRLESMERVLFDVGKFPSVPGRIWDHIPTPIQTDIVGMLRQLYALLDEFLAVKRKYDLEPPQVQQTMQLLLGDGDTSRMRQRLLVSRADTTAALQHSSGWAKRLRWAVWDKKTAQRMVEEFDEWDNRVKQLIETVWWPMPFFSTSAQLLRLDGDADAATFGLLAGLPLRRLLVPNAKQNGNLLKDLDIPKDTFHPQSSFANFTIGSISDTPGTVIVEYKHYEPSPDGSLDSLITQRIRQLALLLHTQSDPRLQVLNCSGFFHDRAHTRFGFVFTLPPELSSKPTTLAAQLRERGPRPSLDTRIALAHTLADSLQRLHSVGWLHKSLRSENIVLFPATDMNDGEILPLDRLKPSLFGFEYARPDSGFSSRRADSDGVRNLYRHPARWWLPEERFGKAHDIYGTEYPPLNTQPR